MDLATKEYLKYEEVADFGRSYPGYAKRCLIEMAEAGDTAEERLVMWY